MTSPAQTRPAPILLAIVALCAVLELAATLGSTLSAGPMSIRAWLLMNGALWPRLMTDWTPVYPGQPAAMFLTHAVLHGSLLHMLFNMLIFLHLGRECVIRLGNWGFLLLFAVTAIGGGAGYALLATGDAPMVGTSGVVFGLFGATAYWDFQRRRQVNASLKPVGQLIIGLIIMNIVMALLMNGTLAWQAHLGGFLAGIGFAALATPSLFHRHRR